MIVVTIACIVFAIYTRLGQARFIEGLQLAGAIIGLFEPLILFFYHWGRNILLNDRK